MIQVSVHQKPVVPAEELVSSFPSLTGKVYARKMKIQFHLLRLQRALSQYNLVDHEHNPQFNFDEM